MDDLADAAEVSRRTLFNYFPSKADAVLGPAHEIPDADSGRFVAGGPTGRLVDDLVQLARSRSRRSAPTASWLDSGARPRQRPATPRDRPRAVRVGRRGVRRADPRARGRRLRRARARLLVQLLVTIFDSAVERSERDAGRPFADLIIDAVRDARAVLTS